MVLTASAPSPRRRRPGGGRGSATRAAIICCGGSVGLDTLAPPRRELGPIAGDAAEGNGEFFVLFVRQDTARDGWLTLREEVGAAATCRGGDRGTAIVGRGGACGGF